MDQIEEVPQKTFRERVHGAAVAGIISRNWLLHPPEGCGEGVSHEAAALRIEAVSSHAVFRYRPHRLALQEPGERLQGAGAQDGSRKLRREATASLHGHVHHAGGAQVVAQRGRRVEVVGDDDDPCEGVVALGAADSALEFREA